MRKLAWRLRFVRLTYPHVPDTLRTVWLASLYLYNIRDERGTADEASAKFRSWY